MPGKARLTVCGSRCWSSTGPLRITCPGPRAVDQPTFEVIAQVSPTSRSCYALVVPFLESSSQSDSERHCNGTWAPALLLTTAKKP